jgi:multiple sugar transport system permease protein
MTTLVTDSSTRTSKPSVAREGRKKRRNPRIGTHIVLGILIIYFVIPFWWLLVASTKNATHLFDGKSSPLWFASSFDLFENIANLFNYSNGIYLQWIENSFIYALVGGLGATFFSVLAGYGFAMFPFKGRSAMFAVLLGSVMVPATALVIPLFVMFSFVHLTNTMWAVLLPSMLNPFAVYLMRVFTQESVPPEMIDAARVDGAGELRIFARVALPLLRPGVVTVLLLSIVATWNNYFLPLVMLSNQSLLPVTVGIGAIESQAQINTGGQSLWNLVIVGALVSIVPLIVAFLTLQRYWQGGLSIGSVK